MLRDAIYDRISIRTYEKKPLTPNERQKVEEIVSMSKNHVGPFGHQIRYFVDHQDKQIDDEAKRIGTYGFIKNAPSFIGGVIKNDFNAIVDYGYLFESIILQLTKAGFGTCWLAGTFNRNAFKETFVEGEIIPAITPVGYPEDTMSLRERAIRFAIKANRRNSFTDMFYEDDVNHPIKEDPSYPLFDALQFVKLAPSASNKQPWRIIIKENRVHFFLHRTPNYNTNRPFVIQALDLGIALFHFEMGLIYLNKSYEIKEVVCDVPNAFEYITSFIIK
ncbi:MAG: nitroreductase family protein [Acholeplasmataceae bacterium]|nr:nitroreductase family protein [Acholeplasmataceae bacterium]